MVSVCSNLPAHPIVSNDDEPLILVDADDREIGHLDKAACHDGEGVLHRAFSAFVFNRRGELLLQRRAAGKRLWGGYWSNSCCSHPRAGESMEVAVERRLQQELGMQVRMKFAYKFEYHARFGEVGSEHELCWVYVGESDDSPVANANEIEETRWLSTTELSEALEQDAAAYTPWFQLEWQELSRRGLLPADSTSR